METTRRPKVCYILPTYNKNIGTHISYLYNFIDSAKKDIDIFLIVEKSIGAPSLDVSNIVVINKSNKVLRLLSSVSACFKARRMGYNNFYIHYSFVGVMSAILIKTFISSRVFYWNCGMPWLYKRTWLLESIFRFILRNTNLVTGTESMKKYYIKYYSLKPNNVFVMPNWIDVEGFRKSLLDKNEARERLGIDKDKKVILFIQRLSKRKGVDLIIPVAESFMDKRLLFLVCGEGPERQNLEFSIKNLDLGDKIILKGSVPQKEIGLYFSAADIFFLPSEEEGFPHAILESMAAGVPYVASNVGGVRDMSPKEQQEFIIDVRTKDNFVAALKHIINNPPSPNILKNHVKKYNPDNSREIFTRLFK